MSIMPRFYLRLVVLPIVIFSTVLLVIHAQPYDDRELREVLPMKCAASCFMGIRPGVTSFTEAKQLLNSDPWVHTISYSDDTYIAWEWSGQQPHWIDTFSEGSVYLEDERVIEMEWKTDVLLGQLILMTGKADHIQLEWYQPYHLAIYRVAYPQYELGLDVSLDCTNRLPYFQPVRVVISSDSALNNPDVELPLQRPFPC